MQHTQSSIDEGFIMCILFLKRVDFQIMIIKQTH